VTAGQLPENLAAPFTYKSAPIATAPATSIGAKICVPASRTKDERGT